jgi:hypothetical protein
MSASQGRHMCETRLDVVLVDVVVGQLQNVPVSGRITNENFSHAIPRMRLEALANPSQLAS